MTATVAAPTGNQFGVLLAIFLVITFVTVVVLWVHERRWDRHEAELADHHEQIATLAGRVQSLADFLGVDVHDAVADDSPGALDFARAPDLHVPANPQVSEGYSARAFDTGPDLQEQSDGLKTDEIPIAPPTVPDGMPLAVQSALLGKSAEWVEVEIAALRARNAERMARAATKEAS